MLPHPHLKGNFCTTFTAIALFGWMGAAAAEEPVAGGPSEIRLGAAAAEEPVAGGPSEIRLGALAHDVGVFGDSVEEGVDVNLELLFHSPEFLGGIGSPRPFLGTSISSTGDTSQIYFGLDWGWDLTANTFAEFQFGGAFHDGENDEMDQSRKELGCSLLFRLGVEAGYRFDRHHALMLHLDHISNADLCDHNDGLETFGVRYGYSF